MTATSQHELETEVRITPDSAARVILRGRLNAQTVAGSVKLFVAGISYRTAPVEIREKFAVAPSQLVPQICRSQMESELDEVVLLSTCNRVEIYGVTRHESGSLDSFLKSLGRSGLDFRLQGYVRESDEAVPRNIGAGMPLFLPPRLPFLPN
jgi:hypothetical protein